MKFLLKQTIVKPAIVKPTIVKAAIVKPQQGFTLLEILIAIAIFALVTFSTFLLFQQSLSSEKQFKQSSESLVALQRTYRLLQNDISQIISRPIRDEYGEFVPAVQLIDTLYGKTIELTRTGRANPLQKNRSDLLRLQYYVKNNNLVRKTWKHLDRSLDTLATEQILLKKMDNLQLQVLSQDDWLDSWPTPSNTIPVQQKNQTQLPRAIEIKITLTNQRTFRWLLPVTINSGLQS